MKTMDSQLQRMFVAATDEVVPPAPWLETEVIEALRRPGHVRRSPRDGGEVRAFRLGLRLGAGLASLLIAVTAVTVLLVSARIHTSTERAAVRRRRKSHRRAQAPPSYLHRL